MIKVKQIDFIDRLPHEVLDTPCWVAALKLVPLEAVPAHVPACLPLKIGRAIATRKFLIEIPTIHFQG